jgi:hypothetical protein
MKKNPIKNNLNNSLLKKKLKLNNFALVLKNAAQIEKWHDKNFFTKSSLNNKYVINLTVHLKLHTPLNFFFFNTFKNYFIFVKQNFQNVNVFKVNNKFFKKAWLSNFFFSNSQIVFFKLNNFFF